MLRYIVESPHTKEECLRALDEIIAKSPQTLDKFVWGCKAGDHTGYAIVEAENEAKVRGMLPSFLKDKMKVISVEKFTVEQIKSLHKAA